MVQLCSKQRLLAKDSPTGAGSWFYFPEVASSAANDDHFSFEPCVIGTRYRDVANGATAGVNQINGFLAWRDALNYPAYSLIEHSLSDICFDNWVMTLPNADLS